MSKGLNINQKNKIALSEVKTRILLTITLNNTEQDVIRIIENDTLYSFEYNQNTYLAAMVSRGQIESKLEGGPQKVNIKISNINQAYSSIIANDGDVLTNSRCSVDEVIFDAQNNIVGDAINIFEGFVNNIQLTEVEFSFDVERILGGYSTQSPNTTFDVNCQWGFKDIRCQYSGGETSCDKTFTACQARSNETRFGGYPSIPQELIIK